METYLAIVIAGAALAGFVQGLAGFGYALVSLSIWAWAVDPMLAAPMAVFGSLIGQMVTIPLLWRGFDFRKMVPFVVGGIIGVPLGIWLLTVLDADGFKLALGLFLIAYCPTMLFVPATTAIRFGGKWADGFFGWLGGIFGGIGGLSGPIPTLWCTLRGMDKESQRGVMQGFNLAMHITTLIGYILAGNIITGETLNLFVFVGIALVIPALLGAMLFLRLDTRTFRRIILGLLFVSGVVLTTSSIGAMFG